MAVQQVRDLAGGRDGGNLFLLRPGGQHLQEVLPDRLFHEQALGVLGQHGEIAPEQLRPPEFLHRLSADFDLAAIGAADAADGLEGGGLAGAVTADDGENTGRRHVEADALEDVGGVLFIAEPDLLQAQGRNLRLRHRRLRFQRRHGGRGVRKPGGKPAPALPDRQRAVLPRSTGAVEHLHRGRHGGEHLALLLPQQAADPAGRVVGRHAALLHDHDPVGPVEDILQTVLRQDDRRAQLPVDLANRVQKVRGGDGVELTGRLVEDQNIGLHGHDGGQVEKLLLPAGQIGHVPVKPVLNAEVTGHLRHPQAHGLLVAAQALETEGQLMPDLVRDDLAVRVLHDVANPGRLLPRIHCLERTSVKEDFAAPSAVGCQYRLEVAQERRLAAAAPAAEGDVFARLDGQADTVQGRPVRRDRIRKCQILDRKLCHFSASQRFISAGIKSRAA